MNYPEIEISVILRQLYMLPKCKYNNSLTIGCCIPPNKKYSNLHKHILTWGGKVLYAHTCTVAYFCPE